MLTRLVLIATISSILPLAAQATWTAEYEFAEGTRVIRTPQAIQLVSPNGGRMSAGQGIRLARGMSMNGMRPTADVALSITLTPRSFAREVEKLGLGAPVRVSGGQAVPTVTLPSSAVRSAPTAPTTPSSAVRALSVAPTAVQQKSSESGVRPSGRDPMPTFTR